MFSRRLLGLVRQQWAGLIALFLVLTTGSAYALAGSNTVFTDDIVDGNVGTRDIHNGAVDAAKIADNQVKTAEIGQDEVRSGDVFNGSLGLDDLGNSSVASPELKDESVTGIDVAPNSLGPGRIADGTLTGTDVAQNSLKGADIDERTLDVGDTARAYARVTPLGCGGSTCNPSDSKGISSVTRDATGSFYCVVAPGISAAETPAAVTVDWNGTTPPEGNASAMVDEVTCPTDGFRVNTQRHPVTSETTVGSALPANDVGFTIVIP
jgi:hypothetical protein